MEQSLNALTFRDSGGPRAGERERESGRDKNEGKSIILIKL